MTSRDKPGMVLWSAIVTVVLLLAVGGYVAGYLWMVQAESPERWYGYTGDVIPVRADYSGKSPFGGVAPRDQVFWERVFAPAHAVDRRIRPGVWRPIAGAGF